MNTKLYRIAVVGTKGGDRRYISGTADQVEISDRANALHWNKREASILARAFTEHFLEIGRTERFQIEAEA
ncbi:hypothetical protein [Primorskyibacter flagellatus]|nr:hypothetical protein [Primorskyibacter flagellatus]